MSTIINTYPVFENSQVLTSAQLNQMVAYLDQQNRLTRVKLIGMGIVCGLDLSYVVSSGDTHVVISKGTAITSEGFLVTLGDCETSFYRPYVLPEGVEYKPFGHPSQDVTLYELLKEMPEDTAGVESLEDPSGFLDNKFVLLFLECFDNDLKSCLGKSCDDLGIDRIFTVRKLLISQADLDKVLTRSGNVPDLYPGKFDLPEIVMPRALFDPDELHSQTYTAFSQHYANTFRNGVYPALFGNLSAPGALAKTYTTYEPLLGPLYGFNNPFETAAVVSLKNAWKLFFEGTSSPGPTYQGIQYFYDFLKDLLLAYNEFKECAFDLMSACCPDMSLFPRHIMLGRANATLETPEEAKTYRHGFIQPPIYNLQKYLIEKTISLHKRLVLMVEKFNLNLVNNPGSSLQVRITPSCEKNSLLSKRSIPYYYKIKEEASIVGDGSLEYFWNFDYTRTKGLSVQPLVVSYENQLADQSTIGSRIQTPLYYDIDDHPFLRIEGHIGKTVNTVADTISDLKVKFNLAFDTILLQLDPDASTVTLDYNHGFEDIQEEYLFHRNVFCAFVKDLENLYAFAEANAGSDFFGNGDINADLVKLKEIIIQLHELCKLLTGCIDGFNFTAFQEGYKNLLTLVIDFILVHKALLDEIEINAEDADNIPVINGFIQRISPVIFKFIDLWFYTKFYRLYYAFKRREFYLRTETAVFSGYIAKHPGVEHQAGVYKGGTFILLYNNSAEKKIIADFNLPYRCCCREVPMCGDEGFVFKPKPFARPDYAITIIDEPVEIDVLINDVGLLGTAYAIEPDAVSAKGGKVESLAEPGPLLYTPKNVGPGIDTFMYRLINKDTGEQDEGRVTILIKEPVVVEGCYTSVILLCWGIERVRETLKFRNLDPNGSDQQAANALLASLTNTKGFTEEEINSAVLEDPDARKQLVKCLGLPDSGSYDELGQRIRDYQNDNCGAQNPCTVTNIKGRVRGESGEALPGVNITVKGTTRGTVTNAQGRFALDLGAVGQTIQISVIGYGLKEITICNEPEVEIILQKSSLGGITVDLGLFDIGTLRIISKARNVTVINPRNKAEVIAAINSAGGNILSNEELRLLTNDALKIILDSKHIEYTTGDTKEQLVDKLFRV